MSATNDPLIARSTDDKRTLLLQALQKKAGGLGDVHPVSLFQEGLVFLSHLQSASAQYNMPYALRLKGQLDRAALEQSLNEMLRRHIPLRAVFKTAEDGQLRQIIRPWHAQALPFSDLLTFPSEQRQSQARRILKEEGQYHFNLAEGPLFRAHLLRMDDDEHWFLFVIHHIAFDLLSIDLFFQELAALYTAYVAGQPSPLRELSFSYANFARWQRQWLRGAEAAAQLAYWRQQFNGPLPILELPADFPRPAEPTGKGSLYTKALSPALPDALKALGQQEGATLFMTLLTAFAVLLYRLTQQEDIIIGTPTANRDRAELIHIVGLLINTLAIRIDLSDTPTFRQVLKRVQRTALDAYANQQVPFPLLVETVQPDRSTGRTPIFQVMFALEQAPAQVVLPELAADFIEHHTETTKFDLTLVIREDAAGQRATFEYNTDLFSATTIQRMAGQFERLLLSVTQNPDQTITTLPYLSESEQRKLLVEWNATTSPYPTHERVVELIEQRANSDPTALAVVTHDDQYTYGELNRRSNQLAHYLRRLGIGPGIPVGICLERSFEMVVALLGVLKAGGAYVPMEASHPRERLAFLIEDAHIPLVLTQRHLLSRLPTEQSRSICLDTDWASIAQEPPERCTIESTTEALAYIIYTSGSTGKPKGVAVTHKNLLNLVFWHVRTYALTTADRTTQLAGVSFDASAWEIWPTLVAGARLYLVNEEVRLSPPKLRDWLSAQSITVSFVPTPLAEELLALSWPASIALRSLLTGGDRLHRYPTADLPFQLVNHYGPTECTVLATAAVITPDTEETTSLPTIGRAIANTQLYVLDRHAQLVPIGMPGELYIGGASVASGYLHQPELTAARFITNPLSTDPADRLYKTGDLVRYLPDGTLDFIGRSDDQVKIRGFRIELGEIESALLKHPLVCEAAATVQSYPGGNPFIAAYIVTEDSQSIADASLRTFLQQMLPEYMLPTIYTQVETLPLTANGGKVDRRALPKVALPSPHASVPEATHNALEDAIIAIWKTILGRENVGLQDNFFELGGHSLLLVRLQEQIHLKLQKEIPLL
ncbi:MAG TPA: amino acid adenylation domain-containing protein, partial [Ktedonobacteraceae bacterium]